MIIGKKEFFTRENIEKNRHHTSPVLTEQVAHCLELVSFLSYEGLDYMFKGGNSLLILLDRPERFSIDVDIATGETKEKIEEVLENIVNKSDLFIRWTKRPHKTKPWLPMTSYYIYYNSLFTEPEETSIMLDAQLKMSPYKKVRKSVSCGEFYYTDQTVLLPSVSSLTGDKLLTLGPATLGIPLNKGKEAQRLKHSFDVSLLASKDLNIDDMRESVRLCMEQENAIQESSFDLKDVYYDTIKYCGSVVNYEEEPALEGLEPYLYEIVKGRKPFEEHILAPSYDWKTLQRDLARSALCLTAVFCPEVTSKDLTETLAYKKESGKVFRKGFKTLSESNPEACHYWTKIIEWLGENPLS